MKAKTIIVTTLLAIAAMLSWITIQTNMDSIHEEDSEYLSLPSTVTEENSEYLSLPSSIAEENTLQNEPLEVQQGTNRNRLTSIPAESNQLQESDYARMIRMIGSPPDPFANARRKYEKEWSDIVAEMELSDSDRLRFEQLWIDHEAYNLDLIHQMQLGTINAEDWMQGTRPESELEEKLRDFLSAEQMETYRNHSQYLRDTFQSEMDARQEELIANQYTDILWYSAMDDLPTVLGYIASGADPNAMPLDGSTTPLHNAARNGNLEMIQALIQAGANVNATTTNSDLFNFAPLHEAAFSGNVEAIRALVAAGADINYYPPDSSHATALRRAAFAGNRDAVAELLALGANATGDYGKYALIDARLMAKDFEIEQMLINAGARD